MHQRTNYSCWRETIKTTHLLRQFIEQFQERSKDLHMVFPNLEKTDDKVLREVLWWTMIEKRVLIKYINIIKDM